MTAKLSLHWLVYSATVIAAFSVTFMCFKVGSPLVTPILFAVIANAVNCLGHAVNLGRKKLMNKEGAKALFSVPAAAIPLAILAGIVVGTNDINGLMMFKAGAPMSVAMPLFGAGTVLLTVFFGLSVLRERLSGKQVFGMLLAVTGIILLNV